MKSNTSSTRIRELRKNRNHAILSRAQKDGLLPKDATTAQKRSYIKFSNDLFRIVANKLVEDGLLTTEDISSKERLLQKLEKIFLDEAPPKFEIVVDHRDTILELADQCVKQGRLKFALIFYATFVEHTLNNITITSLKRSGFSGVEAREILRTVTIAAKSGWLLKILGLPALNSVHRKNLMTLSEERNALLHYKFGPSDDSRDDKKIAADRVAAAKRLITYLKSYEAKITHGGRKTKLKETLAKFA